MTATTPRPLCVRCGLKNRATNILNLCARCFKYSCCPVCKKPSLGKGFGSWCTPCKKSMLARHLQLQADPSRRPPPEVLEQRLRLYEERAAHDRPLFIPHPALTDGFLPPASAPPVGV